MAIEAKADLTPEVVNQVNQLLAPTLAEERRQHLLDLGGNYRNLHVSLGHLIELKQQSLAPFEESAAMAMARLEQSQVSLSSAEDLVSTSQTDLDSVRFRFLAKLHSGNPNHLTLWLNIIKRFTRPPISPTKPLEDLVESAQQAQAESKEKLKQAQLQTEQGIGKTIRQTQSSLDQNRNRLYGSWEIIILEDLDLIEQYVSLIPQRAREVAVRYSEAHAEDSTWEAEHSKFLRDLKRTSDSRADNPQYVRRNWIGRMVDSLIQDWTNRGLINQS